MEENVATVSKSEDLLETEVAQIEFTKESLYTLIKSNSNRVSFLMNGNPQVKSEVWGKFKIVCVDGKPLSFVKCNNCISILIWTSKMGTSAMARHKCSIPEIKKPCPSNQQQLTAMVPKFVPAPALTSINDTVVTGMALDLRPLSAVDGRGFMKIGQALINFGAKFGPHKIQNVVKGRQALRDTHLLKVAENIKKEVKESLAASPNYPYFAFTFDLWTEQKRNRPFISLTCHYVDESCTLQSKLLGVEELPADEKKTTENVRKSCEKIISQYFLEPADVTKVMRESYAITDGGSNVTSVFQNRLPCINHKLNLILEHAFSTKSLELHQEICNTVTKAKLLVKYFKKSGLNALLSTTLKQTVPTRWNSLLIMMESIDKSYHDVQRLLLESRQLEKIEGFRIGLVKEIVQLLKPFQNATNTFSSEKAVTVDKIVPHYFLLEKHLKTEEGNSKEIIRLKNDMMKLLEHYYANSIKSIHLAATALNPKYRSLKMVDEKTREATYNYIRELIASVFNEELQIIAVRNEKAKPSPKKRAKVDYSMRDFQDSSDDEIEEPILDELKSYLDVRLSKSQREDELFDPLDFWKTADNLPSLRRVAFRLLSLPASQTSDERTFSVTGQTINDRRALLGGKTVSALTLINKNYV